VSHLFSDAGLQFNVLSAKDPEREAHIIENAGRLGAITIATNMAGRGTDIKLGAGDAQEREKVLAAGGLYVLGVEHHSSRRTDNQLRGRSGRQGDVGLSQFFLSFDDSFFLPFGKMAFSSISKILADSSDGYTGKLLDDVIKMAHRKIESTFFDARKYMIEFDNIINEQRAHVYQWRQEVLASTSLIEQSKSNRLELLMAALDQHFDKNSFSEQWDLKAAHHDFHFLFNLNFDFNKILEEEDHHNPQKMRALLSQIITESVNEKFAQYPDEWVNELMKQSLLQSIDQNWIENINELELLKSSIQLRSYAQKDPKQEYAREAFELFERLIDTTKKNWNRYLHAVNIQVQSSPAA
jgi:preprotein translocase subunit SecA